MIPYSRSKRSDLYTLSHYPWITEPRVNCLKTIILFTAAHTYIAHLWQYPPSPRATLSLRFLHTTITPCKRPFKVVFIEADYFHLFRISVWAEANIHANLFKDIKEGIRLWPWKPLRWEPQIISIALTYNNLATISKIKMIVTSSCYDIIKSKITVTWIKYPSLILTSCSRGSHFSKTPTHIFRLMSPTLSWHLVAWLHFSI